MARLSTIPREALPLKPGVYTWPGHPDLWVIATPQERATVLRAEPVWQGRLPWHGDPTRLRRIGGAQAAGILGTLEVRWDCD